MIKIIQPPEFPDVQNEITESFERILAKRKTSAPMSPMDRENYRFICELAYIHRVSTQAVRKHIREFDANQLHKQYGIDDVRVVSVLKDFVRRTPELDDAS